MIIDQNEIDALLAETRAFVDEVEEDAPADGAAIAAGVDDFGDLSSDVRRLLRLQVPVIVDLACCHMSVSDVRRLSLGRILEFSKPAQEHLDIRINNQRIGTGEAVKVGENFGLRVTGIRNRVQRINAMGA